jgi:hypothetical protein
MRHIPHARLASPIRRRRHPLVRPVRSHRSRENNRPLHSQLDESPRGYASTVEGAVQVDGPQGVDLLFGEVEGGLVLCAAGVADHTVDRSRFFDDAVDGGGDVFFVGDVCFEGVELAGEAFGDCGEVVAGFADVD